MVSYITRRGRLGICINNCVVFLSPGEEDLGSALIIVLGLVMWLSQVLTLNFELFKSQQFLMAREELLFWLPSYDGLFCSLYSRRRFSIDTFFTGTRKLRPMHSVPNIFPPFFLVGGMVIGWT